MNDKKPYEILITEKMESFPIPDMADAIWAKIELQLDADPGIDSGEQPSTQSATVKKIAGIKKGLFLFITAVIIITVVVLLLLNKKRTDVNKNPDNPPVTTDIIPENSGINEPGMMPGKNNLQPFIYDSLQKNPGAFPYLIDSLTNQIHPDVIQDSLIQQNTIPDTPYDTTTIPSVIKKPKGVKGINNSDYKIISVKKDSANNN